MSSFINWCYWYCERGIKRYGGLYTCVFQAGYHEQQGGFSEIWYDNDGWIPNIPANRLYKTRYIQTTHFRIQKTRFRMISGNESIAECLTAAEAWNLLCTFQSIANNEGEGLGRWNLVGENWHIHGDECIITFSFEWQQIIAGRIEPVYPEDSSSVDWVKEGF